MVDGTEQALAFADSTARPFTPTHVSHKQIEAYPLQRLLLQEETGALVALVKVGEGLRQIAVPRNITARGEPPAGSMLVRYAPDEAHPDGYFSFSPRAAFEAGYSPIVATPATGNMADAVSVLFATFRDELRKLGDSRELAVALTHLDTARLWPVSTPVAERPCACPSPPGDCHVDERIRDRS